ncbi:MAG TPA: hypothetical protein VGG19_17615 [Tepidisphaeraceae bacterium]|jgi:PBP1b-binding outer membrane lipoprotein LpoB
MQTKLSFALSAALLAATLTGCASNPKEVSENQSITTMDLDIQNFNNAAKNLTNQMLLAPRVQTALNDIQQRTGKLPLIKISRIKNDTDLKVNLVTYLVEPIQEVFTNSGKVDFFSEDKGGQDISAAQEAMGNAPPPKLPDFVLHGTVSELDTGNHSTDQTVYVFHLQLTDTTTGTVFFIGDTQIIKQHERSGLSF